MDAPAARPYASWIVERGAPSLVHRGETIGECDRTLRPHRFGVIAKEGAVLSVKGTNNTGLKELRKAIVEDWRNRPSEPVPPPPLVEEPIEIDVPVTRREPEPTTATTPGPEASLERQEEPVEAPAATAATCTRCGEDPAARPTSRTKPGEEMWCIRCRKSTSNAAYRTAQGQRAHAKRIQRPRKVTPRAVRTTEPTSPLAASLDRWEALGAELEELQELVRLGRAVREVTRG